MIRIISDESTVKATLMSRIQCLRDVVLAIGQDIEFLANAQLDCCPSSSSSSSGIVEDNMQFGNGNAVEWSGYP
jgi:hypothetical protein